MDLRAFTLESGISLGYLAKHLGVTSRSLQRYASKEREPSASMAHRIVVATGGAVGLADLDFSSEALPVPLVPKGKLSKPKKKRKAKLPKEKAAEPPTPKKPSKKRKRKAKKPSKPKPKEQETGPYKGLTPEQQLLMQELLEFVDGEFDHQVQYRPKLRVPEKGYKWPYFRSRDGSGYSDESKAAMVRYWKYFEKIEEKALAGHTQICLALAFLMREGRLLRKFTDLVSDRVRLDVKKVLLDAFDDGDGIVWDDAMLTVEFISDTYLPKALRVNGAEVGPMQGSMSKPDRWVVARDMARFCRDQGMKHLVLVDKVVDVMEEHNWLDRGLAVWTFFTPYMYQAVCAPTSTETVVLLEENEPWAKIIEFLNLRPDVEIKDGVAAGFQLNEQHRAEGGTAKEIIRIRPTGYTVHNGDTWRARFAYGWFEYLALLVTPESFRNLRHLWDDETLYDKKVRLAPELETYLEHGAYKGMWGTDGKPSHRQARLINWGGKNSG